jgi:hypothetical protein
MTLPPAALRMGEVSDADSVWPAPRVRMGGMCMTSGWMRCAELRPAVLCCCGEGRAR